MRRRVRALNRRLERVYGPPAKERLDPLDELMLTILSQSTSDTNRDRGYAQLRARFPKWEDVRTAPRAEIENSFMAYGIHLTFLQQVLVVFTALLASIGAAGVPMAGLVTITIILNAVGLPMEGVGLILSVDRILDMMRTCVNVWSDSCGAVTMARLEGETDLKVM